MPRARTFNVLHTGGRLFQQYCTDMWCKTEKEVLDWVKRSQKELRAELYQGLEDALEGDEQINDQQVGTRMILPSSITGSPRQMHQLYQVNLLSLAW